MSFAAAQDAFFSHFFRLLPGACHRCRQPRARRSLAGPDRCGHEGSPGLAGRSPRHLEAQDGLSGEEEIDRRVLLGVIDELRFEEEELDELSWSPISYSYILGSGLFSLLSREFAPLQARLASAAGRMEGIGDVLDAARANLSSGRGREVATFHVEKAIATMPGRRGPVPNGGLDGGRARRHHASDPRRVDGGEGGRRGRPSSSIGCATTSCPARTGTSVSVASCTSASSTTH